MQDSIFNFDSIPDRLKFRGKAKNGEWVYGSLLWYAGDPQIWDKDGKNFIVKPETVGQSTGLKDKNGKLIYERDIIKLQCSREDKGGLFYQNAQIIYDISDNDSGFCVKLTNGNLCALWRDFKMEIIGNIYDNPELLEDKANAS